MVKSEIFDLLLKCNSAQLDAITTKLELNRDFLPGQGQAIATRAIGIVELAEQRDLLAKLEAVLLEIFPRTARTWAAPDDVPPPHIDIPPPHIDIPPPHIDIPPPHIDKQVASPDFADTPRLYPVWFGTNRRPVDPQNMSKGFSAQRDDTKVHYGLCKVAVPKSHKFGSVGSSWWKRLLTLTDDRLKLKELSVLEEAAFWISVRQVLSDWDAGERMALVFNVSFNDAAIRAAQIAFDLKTPGVAAFFSWPSKGRLSLLDYTADEASIEASERQISDFLIAFADKTEAERVHVIAHSMGNRGLLRAMQRVVQTAAQAPRKPFRNIVFAAPDVDAAVFRDLAKVHQSLADRTTLYLSSRDRAVKSSGLIHNAPRAGFVPPITLVEGIDTVEVANADLTLLGHGYYGDAEGVLYDMHELLMHDSPRIKLSAAIAPDSNGKYWRIGE